MYGSNRGFIALMSAVIISAILLVVAIAGSYSGFVARYTLLDTENKEKSAALNDACTDTILSRLAANASYTGPETITVGTESCKVLGVVASNANPEVFEVQAAYKKSYTNAYVSIDTGSLRVVGWQEAGHF